MAYTAGRCRFYVEAAGEWSGVPKTVSKDVTSGGEREGEAEKGVVGSMAEKVGESVDTLAVRKATLVQASTGAKEEAVDVKSQLSPS